MVRWKAKQATRKSACVGIAQCQRLWLGGEKITYGWAGDLVDAQVGWESKPALVKHDARRYLPALVQRDANAMVRWKAKQATRKSACVGIAQCQRLWLGGEQIKKHRKVECFGFARCQTVWLGGKEGTQTPPNACSGKQDRLQVQT